jgi:hypothetical protein
MFGHIEATFPEAIPVESPKTALLLERTGLHSSKRMPSDLVKPPQPSSLSMWLI